MVGLTSRIVRRGAPFVWLWLVAACEHAVPAPRGEPLPARLPAATPGSPDAGVSLPAAAAPASRTISVLTVSDQARRFLALQYQTFHTEFMGCMIGAVRGDTVVVERIAPADVDPAQSTVTWVVPTQTCEGAGWTGVVGTIHSHLAGLRCWYFFPGTSVPTSDAEMHARTAYPVDAIMCGDRVVWIGRRMEQGQVGLSAPGPPPR